MKVFEVNGNLYEDSTFNRRLVENTRADERAKINNELSNTSRLVDNPTSKAIKMTAAEFAEEVLNIELRPYEKEFINEAYEVAQKHQTLKYYPSRRSNRRYYFEYLQALALIMAGQDEGVVKKEIIRE